MSVLVLIEPNDELSLQAITLARSLGGEVHGLSVGAADAPVDVLHVAEIEGSYAPAAWATAVTQLIDELAPAVVVAPGSDRGNEVLAHVAARLDLPFAANVTDVRGDEVTRQRWGGSLLEEARIHADLKLLTAAPFAFAACDDASPARVEAFAPSLSPADTAVRVVETVGTSTGGISLADAKVSPDLYIACGISGATQHIAGCKGAKKLLAINDDPEATIFAHADYAVIGNLHEIVPAISAELRKVRGS